MEAIMRRVILTLAVLGLAAPASAQTVLWGGPGTSPQYGTVTPMGGNGYLVQPMPGQTFPQYTQPQYTPPMASNPGCVWMGNRYVGNC